MNQLINTNPESVTMTSLELVEFINSQRGENEKELRHDNFMAKVPQVLGETVALKFQGYYKASNGKQNPCYKFPKREACLMAMSYSYDLQAKVFDKMTALEAQTINPIANLTRIDLLKLALDSEEKRIALEHKVDELSPKADALDRIATYSDGSFCVRDAAKTLQVQEKKFRQFLLEKNWLYRRPMNAGYLAYSDKLKNGLMEHKITRGEKSDGSEWVDTQARITAKGMVKLSQLLSSERTIN